MAGLHASGTRLTPFSVCDCSNLYAWAQAREPLRQWRQKPFPRPRSATRTRKWLVWGLIVAALGLLLMWAGWLTFASKKTARASLW